MTWGEALKILRPFRCLKSSRVVNSKSCFHRGFPAICGVFDVKPKYGRFCPPSQATARSIDLEAELPRAARKRLLFSGSLSTMTSDQAAVRSVLLDRCQCSATWVVTASTIAAQPELASIMVRLIMTVNDPSLVAHTIDEWSAGKGAERSRTSPEAQHRHYSK